MLTSLCLCVSAVKIPVCLAALGLIGALVLNASAQTGGELESIRFGSEFSEEDASFSLSGTFRGDRPGREEKLIYSLRAVNEIVVLRNELRQTSRMEVSVVQGKLKELVLAMKGEGEITNVTGTGVQFWGIRQNASGEKSLVVQFAEVNDPIESVTLTVASKSRIESIPATTSPITFAPREALLHDGYIRIDKSRDLDVELTEFEGITPLDPEYFPAITERLTDTENEPLTFRYIGTHPTMTLSVKNADPDSNRVLFDNFSLTGTIEGTTASFVLKGTAHVKHPEGGSLRVLSGDAGLTGLVKNEGFSMEFRESRLVFQEDNYRVQAGDTMVKIAGDYGLSLEELMAVNPVDPQRLQIGQTIILPRPRVMPGYFLKFDGPGDFPVELTFDARTAESNGWKSMGFEVATSALRPLVLSGLPEEVEFSGMASPERVGENFETHLPAAGLIYLRWRESKPEEEGRLFFSVDGQTEISISPGLLRQTHVMHQRVMQGEMTRMVYDMDGEGEVTRVVGADILAWNVESNDDGRQLVVQLNQAKTEDFVLTIYVQRPLGVFPLSVEPLSLRPVDAVRYGGHLRVANDGAVSLEVTNASGLSQVSPETFPQSQFFGSTQPTRQTQVFAYRFSDAAFSMEIQADNILPELSVSQILLYHVNETEVILDAEIELEIREAPLREFTLETPTGYVVSQLQNAYLSDYFLTEAADGSSSRLRLVFTQPLTGRQLIQLRLEQNRDLVEGNWEVPKITPEDARSVRGHVGIMAETGVRLTEAASEGLTEIATAFFPRNVEGLQLAWRMQNENWTATANIERMALSVQVDAVHLFSIGEGIVYGSSIMNYLISGAPVSTLRFEVPEGYGNIEFSGKDVRSWQQVDGEYEVSLHSPVFGAYTLLATFDRKFSAQGENLSFIGVQPLNVQSDQGNVIVISDYQFQVTPTATSIGLITLEPAEIPAEHRLLFASPILGAYQYISRPFNLELELASLDQGQTMQQVVDRAAIQTRVSSEGQLLTEATYLIKSQGYSHLRVTIPPGVDLWESNVDGENVVAVADGPATLIPLPRNTNPNAIIQLKLKLAAKSESEKNVRVTLPAIAAPVLLTDWDVVPDEGHRLILRDGSLSPETGAEDVSGFAWVFQLLRGQLGRDLRSSFFGAFGTVIAGLLLLRWLFKRDREERVWLNWLGLGGGAVLCVIGLFLLGNLVAVASGYSQTPTSSLSFNAPVQEAGFSNVIEIKNQKTDVLLPSLLASWPVLIAVGIWIYRLKSEDEWVRRAGLIGGWVFLFWGALRAPNGEAFFFGMLFVFLLIHVVIPTVCTHWKMVRDGASVSGAGGATVAILIGLMLLPQQVNAAAGTQLRDDRPGSVVSSIIQEATVKNSQVEVSATLTWVAEEDAILDFLRPPAVLAGIEFPAGGVKLSEGGSEQQPSQRLIALRSGTYEIRFSYNLSLGQAGRGAGVERGFNLPTPHGLINRLTLDVPGEDVDVQSVSAVSVKRSVVQGETLNTHAELVLRPQDYARITWQPRSRDTSQEEAVFYAEWTHLFVPSAGVVDGAHILDVRLAQGQLSEVVLQVPERFTIANVEAPFVSTWRFDPDTRRLRVQFSAPQSGPFQFAVESQIATEPLPYSQAMELVSITDAAGQVGLVGVATGEEVQLNNVAVENLTPINLEDYPSIYPVVDPATGAIIKPGLEIPGVFSTLRRAFRYSDLDASLTINAAAVEPDVRVVSNETLSIGRDRTVLAATLNVNITRAGVFRLSFVLPENFEVESLSGSSMSHWTELETDGERVITVHMLNRTMGQQSFSLTLAGTGLGDQTSLEAPRLIIREAAKQSGQLAVVPEQGLRLYVDTRQSVTQLDPQQVGIRQRGVLAFRLLQNSWQLSFNIEQVEPWIEVSSLQDVTIREGQVKLAANFEYTIENTGVNSLSLQLPADAESVVFNGEFMTDSVRTEIEGSGFDNWEVKLSRRVIGNYRLKVNYQMVIPRDVPAYTVSGIQVQDVNLQRGYLTLRSGGRLQVNVPQLPAALQTADWQSISPSLLQGIESGQANHTFRVIEPVFDLPVNLVRHEVASVLEAQIEQVDLTSTISQSGAILTEVKLTVRPNDKRLFKLKLPARAEFWFAFVNGESVSPWRDGNEILIPLEKNSDLSQPSIVDFFYASELSQGEQGMNYRVVGPEFDLPLENITWKMFVSDEWAVKDWDDRWQLKDSPMLVASGSKTIDAYVATENVRQQAQTRQAEELLNQGNFYLQQGAPQQAREAYRAAYELSQHDAAFNEDARVQLQNLKTQQALVGLNVLQNNLLQSQQVGNQAATPGIALDELSNYTQDDARRLIEFNSTEDNTALMQLADRLLKQQEAAVETAEAVHATLPEEGQLLTFTRSLHVDTWSNLQIDIDAATQTSHAWLSKFLCLLVLAALVGGLLLISKRPTSSASAI